MTTGKTTALTRTFVGKVMSLLFNMLSRLVIVFLPRSKCLLISLLQSPSTVTLEYKKIVCHCFHCFPIYLPWRTGSPVLHYLLEFAQIHICCVSDAVWPSSPLCPLLLLPSVFPSIRVFSSESVLHIRWPKYWSFSFSISPSNEYLGLISSRMDWLDLLEVQGTHKSMLQQYSSKASILWPSAFFIVQLSHPYMTTGKTIALTRRTLVSEVMSLLFNRLSRLVIVFLPRSKHLLISWL